MKQCAWQGLPYGVGVCTDACGGYYSSEDSIGISVYRYYLQGPAPDDTSWDTPAGPAPTEEYHPTSPRCFRGCCPSGMNCEKSIEACGASGTYATQGPAPDDTSCDTPAGPAPTEEYHPTSPRCFRGCCTSGMNGEKSIEACGASGTYANGYTNSYSAAAAHPVGLAVNTGGCAADDLVCTNEHCSAQGELVPAQPQRDEGGAAPVVHAVGQGHPERSWPPSGEGQR